MESFYRLQRMIMKSDSEKTQKLFYRTNGRRTKEGFLLKKGQWISADTYFNSFSAGVWKKYTNIDKVRGKILFSGKVKLDLIHTKREDDGIKDTVLCSEIFQSDRPAEAVTEIKRLENSGFYYLKMTALCDNTAVYAAGYEGVTKKAPEDIRLAVDICTYKRQEVIDNICLIRDRIIEDKSSPVCGKVELFVIDNGKTVENCFNSRGIHILKNKNVGGSGGFTRGMMEIIKTGGYSHVLLMDDDVTVIPESVEKLCLFLGFLKEAYREYTVGGALLRKDSQPYIQFELGARWNRGLIKSLKQNLDLRNKEALLINEEEEKAEYMGWWFCCIPAEVIKISGLPLPLFLHRDDVEYGLRTGERFIGMNGIAIWHEVYDTKLPGIVEYYDIRNLAVVESVYGNHFSKWRFKYLLGRWVCGNIARFRYNYAQMNIRGALDFLKGARWLMETDAVRLNKEISDMNYKSRKWEEKREVPMKKNTPREQEKFKIFKWLTMNGHFFREKEALIYIKPYQSVYDYYRAGGALFIDNQKNYVITKRSRKKMISCLMQLLKAFVKIDRDFDKAKESYGQHFMEMTQDTFWKNYLREDMKNEI